MATALLDSLKKSIGKKNKSQAFSWVADLERESGDLETALARVDGGLTFYPNDVPAMLVRSMILFQKGEFEECIAECEKALKFDPFCLSAQKRMGDAYEQLGNENERNKCYRRVHDMDPLDTFWKEEYDHVEEVAAAAAVAGAAAMSDADFAMPDDFGAAETPAAPAETTATEEPLEGAATEAAANADEAMEDDPFAAFASLSATMDSGDDSAMDTLQNSLDSVMQDMLSDEPSAPEVFPTDEEVSGNDVGAAFNDMFGEDDDLEPEAPLSPFAKLDLPTSLDDEPAADKSSAQTVFGDDAVAEDKPQSVDSAFNDIFGEDELPEENPQPAPAAEDKPQSVDSAFNDIFGEDELPEEKPQPAPAAEDKPQSVDSAFNDIFGEDELPEEKPQPAQAAESADSLFEKSSESSLFEKSAEEDSLFEKSAEDSAFKSDELTAAEPEDSLFEKSADFDTKPAAETPAVDDELTFEEPLEAAPATEEEPALEEPLEAAPAVAEEPALEEPAATETEDDKPFSVDSAFDALFGEDEVPEEKPAEEQTAAPVEEKPAESLAEQVSQAETELEIPEPEPAKDQAEDFAKEMGGALISIFGNDDDDLDIPEVKHEEKAEPSQEDTGAAVEEAPLQQASLEADLDKSFNMLFGEDEIPEDGAPAKAEQTPAEEAPVQEAPAAVDTKSLESAVDGAFKGLFESDDDSLPEEPAAGNKGVDFLMSDDSDDEVSSGLIKDPSAPLERGATDLDESLNTKTLAEIYFEQGLYGKALDIYQDLARKEPDNEEITNRLAEIEKVYREKFGGASNG